MILAIPLQYPPAYRLAWCSALHALQNATGTHIELSVEADTSTEARLTAELIHSAIITRHGRYLVDVSRLIQAARVA